MQSIKNQKVVVDGDEAALVGSYACCLQVQSFGVGLTTSGDEDDVGVDVG